MEILDHADGPTDIIELDDLPAGLEIEDFGHPMMPGGRVVMLPGSAGPTITPEEEQEQVKERDWQNDGNHAKFMVYLSDKLQKIPPHSGNTTVGCEKAISFLKRLDKEISKAVQGDEDNVIDETEAEKIRDTIMDYVAQLEEAHSKLLSGKRSHKKASVWLGKEVVARLNNGEEFMYYVPVVRDGEEDLMQVSIAEPTNDQVQLFVAGEPDQKGLLKEAGSAKIVLFEDPFLHSITRILINAHVSAGRNIEEVYAHLNKKYSFTPREELSIQELLLQKGMPIHKDFGRLGEIADPSDGGGIEYSTQYFA